MPPAHRKGDTGSGHGCHFSPTPATVGGAATVLIAAADFGLMITEQELEQEIQRRLDHNPDDQVDPNFLQSRTRELGVRVDLPDL